jgi:hypothetical protein
VLDGNGDIRETRGLPRKVTRGILRYGTASLEMLDINSKDYRRKPEALATNGARDERDFCRLKTGMIKKLDSRRQAAKKRRLRRSGG